MSSFQAIRLEWETSKGSFAFAIMAETSVRGFPNSIQMASNTKGRRDCQKHLVQTTELADKNVLPP